MLYSTIIDELGDDWLLSPGNVRKRLGTCRTADRLIPFLTTKCGFISARRTPLGASLTLSTNHVAPLATIGAMRWLVESHVARVLMVDCSSTNDVQSLLPCQHALARLEQIYDERRNKPNYERRNVDVAFTPFADRWEVALEVLKARAPKDATLRILAKLFDGHFTISIRNAEGRYVIESAGPALEAYGGSLGAVGNGRAFDDLSDQAYGRWIADHYSSFRASDAPTAEFVEATIGASTNSQLHLRYNRLIIPFEADHREHLFVAAAVN
jgi:hypothetical protein